MNKILVIGANGQLGTELVIALQEKFGNTNIITSDITHPAYRGDNTIFEVLDVKNKPHLMEIVKQYEINHIYHLAAILSGKAEKRPDLAWELNMQGLLNVLDIARENKSIQIYWPSSIGVFGPSTPKENTPQSTIMDPNTVYGISKLAGERWCAYYHEKYGVDVRSLRYPGLIGYKSLPGGGTTDYAVDIFYKALQGDDFECFLSENTYLPMMYIEDAVKATIQIMAAPAQQIKIRSSYNLAAFSFSPKEIYEAVKVRVPDFTISYKPDFRQAIADSWPSSIDDTEARRDWGWTPDYNLEAMVDEMLVNLKSKLVHN
jgi:nucleoside-diphosphate-sugar epimerase